jgi:outer membrane protein assembly factor BamB
VGSNDGNVYAIDLTTGAKRWSFQTGGLVQTSPAAADGLVFAVGENARTGIATLFAIDASNGTKVWSYAPPNASLHVSSPTVAAGHVFEAFGDGAVRAFDERTGSVAWSSAIRGLFSPSNALAYADGAVFAMDATGALYDLDAASGLRRWDFQFAPSALHGAPLVANGTVYVGLDDGSVAAVEVSTGVRVWLRRLVGGPAGGLAAADGTLFVPYSGLSGGIVAFRHSGGALIRVESPTVLHLGVALGGFAAAAALVLAGLLALFGFLARRSAAGPDGAADGLGGEG